MCVCNTIGVLKSSSLIESETFVRKRSCSDQIPEPRSINGWIGICDSDRKSETTRNLYLLTPPCSEFLNLPVLQSQSLVE